MPDRAEAVFEALAHPARREMVQLLAARDSATATELAREFPLSRQAVLKHLDVLDWAGLVGVDKIGREARFRLTPDPLRDAVGWLTAVGDEWDGRLDALGRHLRRTRRR
jgi:DNA-binding transcriptional ArsR family regulator